jgi:hypothetical protein
MPSQAPNSRRAPNALVYLLMASGLAGTGSGYLSRDEAATSAEARDKMESQLQHCQERESDRMWQLLNPGAKP